MNPFKNEQVWNKKKRQVELQDYSFSTVKKVEKEGGGK